MPYVYLRWKDNSSAEDGFKIYRSLSPIDTANPPAPIATLAANVLNYKDNSAVVNAMYYYRIGAYRGSFVAFSEEISVFTDPNSTSYDPNFSNVELLIHADGAHGSNSFSDSSGFNRALTTNGNAKITTEFSKFGGASIELDGINSNISFNKSAINWPAGVKGTIECFIRPLLPKLPSRWGAILTTGLPGASSQALGGAAFQYSSDMKLIFIAGNLKSSNPAINQCITSNACIRFGEFQHVVFERDTVPRIFVDGISQPLSFYNNTPFMDLDFNSPADEFARIGCFYSNLQYFNGQIDELRVTKGVCRYVNNFTPPVAAFFDW